MLGLIQLNRLMRRYGRVALVAAALLGVLAVIATASAASMSMGAHHHHMAGHGKSTVVMCVALGGCVLVVATAAAAVPRLAQRGVWSISAPPLPAVAWAPAPARSLARAGPPPLLQVFRL